MRLRLGQPACREGHVAPLRAAPHASAAAVLIICHRSAHEHSGPYVVLRLHPVIRRIVALSLTRSLYGYGTGYVITVGVHVVNASGISGKPTDAQIFELNRGPMTARPSPFALSSILRYFVIFCTCCICYGAQQSAAAALQPALASGSICQAHIAPVHRPQPAPWGFYIWGVIYAYQGLGAVYAMVPNGYGSDGQKERLVRIAGTPAQFITACCPFTATSACRLLQAASGPCPRSPQAHHRRSSPSHPSPQRPHSAAAANTAQALQLPPCQTGEPRPGTPSLMRHREPPQAPAGRSAGLAKSSGRRVLVCPASSALQPSCSAGSRGEGLGFKGARSDAGSGEGALVTATNGLGGSDATAAAQRSAVRSSAAQRRKLSPRFPDFPSSTPLIFLHRRCQQQHRACVLWCFPTHGKPTCAAPRKWVFHRTCGRRLFDSSVRFAAGQRGGRGCQK